MKQLKALLILPALFAAGAYAQEEHQIQAEISVPGFEAADKDEDGMLSFMEAVVLFPSLMLTDADNDGFLAKDEAEANLPGLDFGDDGHESNNRIGPAEYELMAAAYVNTFQTASPN
jgi:hypothetical protein